VNRVGFPVDGRPIPNWAKEAFGISLTCHENLESVLNRIDVAYSGQDIDARISHLTSTAADDRKQLC
jgi:hypothetical protein